MTHQGNTMDKRTKIRIAVSKFLPEERGQALIMVLVFLLLGSLTITPLLSYMGTALKTGRMYQDKTEELYAADSGIEDAIWQIKYDRLEVLLSDPDYDIYDFGTVWTYSVSEPINDLTAEVSIQNVWIPKDVAPLSPNEARDIIESNKLMVAGTAPGETSYQTGDMAAAWLYLRNRLQQPGRRPLCRLLFRS